MSTSALHGWAMGDTYGDPPPQETPPPRSVPESPPTRPSEIEPPGHDRDHPAPIIPEMPPPACRTLRVRGRYAWSAYLRHIPTACDVFNESESPCPNQLLNAQSSWPPAGMLEMS